MSGQRLRPSPALRAHFLYTPTLNNKRKRDIGRVTENVRTGLKSLCYSSYFHFFVLPGPLLISFTCGPAPGQKKLKKKSSLWAQRHISCPGLNVVHHSWQLNAGPGLRKSLRSHKSLLLFLFFLNRATSHEAHSKENEKDKRDLSKNILARTISHTATNI